MTTRSSKDMKDGYAPSGGRANRPQGRLAIGHVMHRMTGIHKVSGSTNYVGLRICLSVRMKRSEAYRAISTGQLRVLPRFHIQPIDVVVFHGSQGIPGFEGGFPLRCLQRLSRPYLATLLCHWRDNRSTRDTSTPVLSY